MGNKGAFITIRGDNLTPRFTSFTAVDHPSVSNFKFFSAVLNWLFENYQAHLDK